MGMGQEEQRPVFRTEVVAPHYDWSLWLLGILFGTWLLKRVQR